MQAILRSRPLARRAAGLLRQALLPAVFAALAGLAVVACPGPAHSQPGPPGGPSPTAPPPPPAPEKKIVADIIIQGNHQAPAEYVKNRLKTRVDKEYVPEMLQEDIRSLYATRQFANVWADVKDTGQDRVTVFIYIRDYPSLVEKVTYQGNNNLSTDDLDQITNVRKGMPLNPTVNRVACRAIVRRYNEDGRPFASCTLLKGGEPGDTEVIFSITEGPKVKVRDIDFTGNTFVSSAVLYQRINSSKMFLGIFGGTYNAAMADNDVVELIKYYRSFGYHDVKVNRELVYTGDGRELKLIFHINEGVRYRLADAPQIVGVKSMSPETLEAFNKMGKGDYFDERKIKTDTELDAAAIGYRGRKATVTAVPVYSPDQPGLVRVNYEVDERPPARVGQIYIVGNERTRQNVILRQLPLYPGQILTYPDLVQAEKNLARLNIFESTPDGSVRPRVTVLDNPLDQDNPVKDILVNVQEASTGSLMFGVGVNSDVGLTGSIVLNERNFDITRPPTSIDDLLNGTAWRGAGQELRIEAVPGTMMQRYSATFREPFLFDSPFSLTASAYYWQMMYNEYTEERLGARFTLGRKLDNAWSVVGSVRLEDVGVSNVGFGAPPDYTNVEGYNPQAGFKAAVTRDTRDSLLRPTEGSLFDVSFEEVIGNHGAFSLANADFTKFWTVWQRADGSGRQVLMLHDAIGWASDNTPVYERFFAGGFRSIRGFQFRGVGPDINGFKVGGDFLVLNSLEYQVPVQAGDKIFLVGFVDSGTVTPNISTINDYRVSVGFGVRFVVPMLGPVPIALDFGFPIIRGPRDQQQVFNFFMGFSH
jgi:outer membrane protein insertion porin family